MTTQPAVWTYTVASTRDGVLALEAIVTWINASPVCVIRDVPLASVTDIH